MLPNKLCFGTSLNRRATLRLRHLQLRVDRLTGPIRENWSLQIGTPAAVQALRARQNKREETTMGFGRGALLWLIGIPLPIILLLALFMHH
jgi:hypothetical protein